MIIRQGDLFTSQDPIIAHGCNNRGVMGAGVAKIIRERLPRAFEDYMVAISSHTRGDGTVPLGWNNYSRQHKNLTVVNMITQTLDKVERPVSYDAIDLCFADLFRWMEKHGHMCVSIPKIGAGLGGGDWNIIEAIIRAQEKRMRCVVTTVWEL